MMVSSSGATVKLLGLLRLLMVLLFGLIGGKWLGVLGFKLSVVLLSGVTGVK